jgi:hypothetical protein
MSRRMQEVGRQPFGLVSRTPIEWMDAGSWRLPSGRTLAEFALEAGFAAPLVMMTPPARLREPADRVRRAAESGKAPENGRVSGSGRAAVSKKLQEVRNQK